MNSTNTETLINTEIISDWFYFTCNHGINSAPRRRRCGTASTVHCAAIRDATGARHRLNCTLRTAPSWTWTGFGVSWIPYKCSVELVTRNQQDGRVITKCYWPAPQAVAVRQSPNLNTLQIFTLTRSPPIPSQLYTLPYWSNPPFLIFDIRALWRSGLSARAPECQKLKMVV